MINRPHKRHARSFLTNSRLKKRRRIRKYFRLFLFIAFIVSCIIGFIYLANTEYLRLKDITVSGTRKLDSNDINTFLFNQINSRQKTLGLISPNSSLLIDEEELEKALAINFSRIQSVRVSNSYTGHMTVILTERQGLARWCQGLTVNQNIKSNIMSNMASSTEKTQIASSSTLHASSSSIIVEETEMPEAKENEICYEFDKAGYIFDRVIYDKGLNIDNLEGNQLTMDIVQPSIFGGLVNGNPIGQRFLDTEKLNNIFKVIQFLNSIGLRDQSVICQTIDLCTIDIDNNGLVYIDISADNDLLIKRLGAVFENKALKNMSFKYVDARYGNKVFYKTDETVESESR